MSDTSVESLREMWGLDPNTDGDSPRRGSGAASVDLDTVASRMISAFEDLWAALRARHENLPPVVFLIGRATSEHITMRTEKFARGKSDIVESRLDDPDELCDSTGRAWKLIEPVGKTRFLDEVYLGGEALAQPVERVFGKVLREAAILLAFSHSVTPLSRQGRYHNRKFWNYAEQVGLIKPERMKGVAPAMKPTPEVIAEYSAEISRLKQSIVAYRKRKTPVRSTESKSSEGRTLPRENQLGWLACECDDKRFLTGQRGALQGDVICGIGGEKFKVLDKAPREVTWYGSDGKPSGRTKVNPRTQRVVDPEAEFKKAERMQKQVQSKVKIAPLRRVPPVPSRKG